MMRAVGRIDDAREGAGAGQAGPATTNRIRSIAARRHLELRAYYASRQSDDQERV